MCDIEKIINRLTPTEQENIGEILRNLEKENKENIEKIRECIDNCTSPQELTEKNLTKIKTIFNAFNLFSISETQILILGQDPYPANKYPNMADGLAFSQNRQQPPVESLLNIFKAIKVYKDDMNRYFCDINNDDVKWNTNLENWAKKNGILLLNTALTHEKKEKEVITKHQNAWKPFVKQIICNLINSKIENSNNQLAVFLWGVPAQNLFYEAIKNKKERFSVFIEYYEKNSKNKDGKVGKKLIQSYCYQINNLKIFLTSHPSKQGFWRGFKNVAPNHFEACDDFLCDNIWKNFPENNTKQ